MSNFRLYYTTTRWAGYTIFMEFKRTTYIALFMILGALIFGMLHTIALSIYAKLLLGNWYLWSFGYTWHEIAPFLDKIRMAFTIYGLVAGYLWGRHFWPRLYDEAGHLRGRKSK